VLITARGVSHHEGRWIRNTAISSALSFLPARASEAAMFRIRDLAVQSIEATSDDPKGNMLGFGPIYKLLDTEGSRNPHLANPLNHPRRGYIRRRENPLRGDEIVNGEFLSLIYCNHDPFVRLTDHDDLASLEAMILSPGGLLNPYINYLVAFISGKVAKYQITYVGPEIDVPRPFRDSSSTVSVLPRWRSQNGIDDSVAAGSLAEATDT
jgi:hypothetical protein